MEICVFLYRIFPLKGRVNTVEIAEIDPSACSRVASMDLRTEDFSLVTGTTDSITRAIINGKTSWGMVWVPCSRHVQGGLIQGSKAGRDNPGHRRMMEEAEE